MSSVAKIVAGVQSGDVTAESVLDGYLAAAQADPHNAFLTLDEAGARRAAQAIDARRAKGETLGPLAGVPIGLKDIFSTRGLRTTCASQVLADYVPPYDATVVTRLRSADAVIMGKLNMDEFAMGSSNENSAFGPVLNPWDRTRVPGGSSGGSAAAVAARLCPITLGTDTGGSIRQPAALCGVVGLKPTYGRVSRFGMVAFASSLDQAGPLGASVRDVASAYRIIAGTDPRDATTAEQPVTDWAYSARLDGLRIGVPDEYLNAEGLEPDVRARFDSALEALRELGSTVESVSLPSTGEAVAAYYIVATAEASSNLGRYDGVRYGHRAQASSLGSMYTQSRRAFGPEVRRRLMLGTFALSSGYYDAYYGKALAARRRIADEFDQALSRVDLIVTPTSPTTAFPLGARTDDPLSMYLADVFTVPTSLAGLPAASIPCGFDRRGLPVGLQLIGRRFDEATVLRAGAAYEDHAAWPTEPGAKK